MVQIEDFMKKTFENKDRKMNAINAKSLNTMKQKLKKWLKARPDVEKAMEEFRKVSFDLRSKKNQNPVFLTKFIAADIFIAYYRTLKIATMKRKMIRRKAEKVARLQMTRKQLQAAPLKQAPLLVLVAKTLASG